MSRILDWDGTTLSTFHHDEMTGQSVIQSTVDVAPILEENKRLQNLNDGYSPSRELRRVASIPNVVYSQWCAEDGISLLDFMAHPKHYKQWLRKKLYSSDNRHLLTAPHK